MVAATLSNLNRRWIAATDRGKGIKLSAAELDLLNSIGGGVLIAETAATEQRSQATSRIEQRQGGQTVARPEVDTPKLTREAITHLGRNA